MIPAQRREKIDLKRWKKIRKMSLQIFLKSTYMLLRHMNYMILHFGKAYTLSFWENSGQSDLSFCSLTVHVVNVCVKNLYLCWVVLKNINGMKWRCRIFEEHRWFISWFIYWASRTIYTWWKKSNFISSKFKSSRKIRTTN